MSQTVWLKLMNLDSSFTGRVKARLVRHVSGSSVCVFCVQKDTGT